MPVKFEQLTFDENKWAEWKKAKIINKRHAKAEKAPERSCKTAEKSKKNQKLEAEITLKQNKSQYKKWKNKQ